MSHTRSQKNADNSSSWRFLHTALPPTTQLWPTPHPSSLGLSNVLISHFRWRLRPRRPQTLRSVVLSFDVCVCVRASVCLCRRENTGTVEAVAYLRCLKNVHNNEEGVGRGRWEDLSCVSTAAATPVQRQA